MSNVCTMCTKTKKSNFGEPLEYDGSVFTHLQNIRFLAIKILKVFQGVRPQIVKEIFQLRYEMPYQQMPHPICI